MSFHREFSKILSKKSTELAVKQPWYRQAKPKSPLQQVWEDKVLPLYWQYWKVPHEKFAHRMMVSHLRGYGMMYDDTLNEKEPLMERAMEMLPYDIRVQRYRRLIRANDLSMKKYHLPVAEQNYDPMIPYLAPYIEEAKFMMQEEQELFQYHPWDRRVFVDGTSGFGETTKESTFFAW